MKQKEESKFKLAEIKQQIVNLENQLKSLTNLTEKQKETYYRRESQFKEQQLKYEQFLQQYEKQNSEMQHEAELQYFQKQFNLNLEKSQQKFQELKNVMTSSVDLEYMPLIKKAEQQLEETRNFSDRDILLQILPQQYVDDYMFLQQFNTHLEKQQAIHQKAICKYQQQITLFKQQQQQLIEENIKLKQECQSYQQSFKQSKLQAQQDREKQKTLLQQAQQKQKQEQQQKQKKVSQKQDLESNESKTKHLDNFIEYELKELEAIKALPTPIRSYVQEVYSKYLYLIDKRIVQPKVDQSSNYDMAKEMRMIQNIYNKKSCLEEKYGQKIERNKIVTDFTGKVEVGMIVDELMRNELMFTTAAVMK